MTGHATDPDDIPIPPEVSALMDAQEQILELAEAAGRPELRAALADLFTCDDVGLVERAHECFAGIPRAIRDVVREAARDMEIDGPEEGT